MSKSRVAHSALDGIILAYELSRMVREWKEGVMPHKIKGKGKAVCALPEGHAGECEPRDPDTFPGFASESDDEPPDSSGSSGKVSASK